MIFALRNLFIYFKFEIISRGEILLCTSTFVRKGVLILPCSFCLNYVHALLCVTESHDKLRQNHRKQLHNIVPVGVLD